MILLLGGSGRLGRRLRVAFAEVGVDHVAPPRDVLAATDQDAIVRYARDFGARLLVSTVAFADVPGCDADPRRAFSSNEHATYQACSAAERLGIPLLWTSTDYLSACAVDGAPSLPLSPLVGPGAPWFGAYVESKMLGEDAVVAAATRGVFATACRVAFADPDDALRWTWIDGFQLSNREWVEGTAYRFAKLSRDVLRGRRLPAVVHLGPETALTRLDLVRARFPDHPAFRGVDRRIALCNADRVRRFGANPVPGDSRMAGLLDP